MKKKIAIFASGSGTNAEEIIKHFNKHDRAEIALILSNNPDAFVLQRAANHHIPSMVFNRQEFYKGKKVDEMLAEYAIDFVVLAGFMWLVPERLVSQFHGKMMNIHPALLPKYGGKGMYGEHVHQAVVQNKESESGITIHWVNKDYDEGDIIYQAKCQIDPRDDAAAVAAKVHQLEYQFYPAVIEKSLLSIENSNN